MGLLKEGKPLHWHESKQVIEYVKEHGIIQFLNTYEKYKNRKDLELKWGDEIEYIIVKYDKKTKSVRLELRADELLHALQKPEHEYNESVAK